MLRRSRRVLIFLYTLRRAALASRTTTTYHIQQLTSRTTTTNDIQQLCPMNEIAGSEALPRSRRGHQTNSSTALSTVSHGPSRYPIVRTSWYRLRSPYASLPANLERVAETWNRLAPSFWAPIASEFFFKHGGTPTYMFTIKGILGKRKRWRDRFNLALANQQSLFYLASYFASVLNPSIRAIMPHSSCGAHHAAFLGPFLFSEQGHAASHF